MKHQSINNKIAFFFTTRSIYLIEVFTIFIAQMMIKGIEIDDSRLVEDLIIKVYVQELHILTIYMF